MYGTFNVRLKSIDLLYFGMVRVTVHSSIIFRSLFQFTAPWPAFIFLLWKTAYKYLFTKHLFFPLHSVFICFCHIFDIISFLKPSFSPLSFSSCQTSPTAPIRQHIQQKVGLRWCRDLPSKRLSALRFVCINHFNYFQQHFANGHIIK